MLEYSRRRPWTLLTRDFWDYVDMLLAELNASTCSPPVKTSSSLLFLVVLIILYAPFALIGGLPIFLLTKLLSTTNHCFKIVESKSTNENEPKDELTIISANLCLMPEGLARMNNLPDVAGRAAKIGDVVIAQETIALDEACDELAYLVEELPNQIDVICFQEIFNETAWHTLNAKLEKAGYRYFLYDPHTPLFKSKSFHFFPIVNSGLYIASKLPIIRAHFEPFKNAYLEDGLCNKGILLAEVALDAENSAIVANTHMQAPTSGCRIKASKARSKQWDELTDIINEFKSSSDRTIKLETVMGDFNTDFLNPYDVACKENAFYERFTDAHPAALGRIGTCLVEQSCRAEQVATPSALRQVLTQCDEKYVWSSDIVEDDEAKQSTNGKTKFDFIFYTGPNQGDDLTTKKLLKNAQIHTTFAQLTDHLTLSVTFQL